MYGQLIKECRKIGYSVYIRQTTRSFHFTIGRLWGLEGMMTSSHSTACVSLVRKEIILNMQAIRKHKFIPISSILHEMGHIYNGECEIRAWRWADKRARKIGCYDTKYEKTRDYCLNTYGLLDEYHGRTKRVTRPATYPRVTVV